MANSFLNKATLPLGLRNNNPGNLRPVKGGWQGEIGTNKGFSVFSDVAWGLRAMATDIIGDMFRKGKNNLTDLIYEYAPPSENNTVAYIKAVSDTTGFAPKQKIPNTYEAVKSIIRAKMNVELGKSYSLLVSDADIDEALKRLSPTTANLLKKKSNPVRPNWLFSLSNLFRSSSTVALGYNHYE